MCGANKKLHDREWQCCVLAGRHQQYKRWDPDLEEPIWEFEQPERASRRGWKRWKIKRLGFIIRDRDIFSVRAVNSMCESYLREHLMRLAAREETKLRMKGEGLV